MVTGVSYDFHVMAFSTVSESSEWWRSMAAVVIFGLAISTVLTLVVVPSLYVLIEDIKSFLSTQWLRQWSRLTDLMSRLGSSWKNGRDSINI